MIRRGGEGQGTTSDADSEAELGLRYYNGEDVTKDQAEAVKWWRKAAEQNPPDAQYNLGVCYAKG